MFNSQSIQELNSWLSTPQTIVITAHKSADGDSVGSSVSLYNYLIKKGHQVHICHPDKAPGFLNWLTDTNQILTYEDNQAEVKILFNQADYIFCLDYNHPSRVGDMQDALFNASGKKIMVDHHQSPDEISFDLLFSFPKISSTCELVYELIDALGDNKLIDESIGNSIYCGIMTDTGSFRFPSTTARTHSIIADLINKGVKNNVIHERTFDTNTIDRIKLNGFALSEKLTLIDEYQVAYICLTKDEQKKFKATKGDTEGLVNKALSIQGVKMAIFFKEDSGYIKISFRSKGDVFVNKLAQENFEGGGHIYAAGGKFDGSMNDAVKKMVTLIPNYVNQ